MGRTLAISDIHGGLRGLEQVLNRSNFDSENDTLICLGDVCDGWKETVECIRRLNEIPNLIYLMGNHDDWTKQWLQGRYDADAWGIDSGDYRCWTSQGGKATVDSIIKHQAGQEVLDFLNKAKIFHQQDYKLFVHAGIRPDTKAEDNTEYDMIWDRSLVKEARLRAIESEPVVPYDEIFVGHTPTICYEITIPTKYNNLWMIDTGASYDGPLTIIDVDTKEYWQSDPLVDLYPGETAR